MCSIQLSSNPYLFKYDSVFGPWPGEVTAGEGTLTVDGREMVFSAEHDLSGLDLSDIDVVLECTGKVMHAGTRTIVVDGEVWQDGVLVAKCLGTFARI